MLQPKRTKFRKAMKGRNRGLAHRGSKVSFGEYALKATGRGRITARQIEAAAQDRTTLARMVCDYIAGMTDRFAAREHERLTGRRLLA